MTNTLRWRRSPWRRRRRQPVLRVFLVVLLVDGFGRVPDIAAQADVSLDGRRIEITATHGPSPVLITL